LPKTGQTLPPTAEAGTVRVLLLGGGGSHDWERLFFKEDSETLKAAGGIIPAFTSNLDEALTQMEHADVIVLSANHPQYGSLQFQSVLKKFADAGHGVVVLHAGTWYNWVKAKEYNVRFVGGGVKSHGAGVFQVFNKMAQHPVMAGVPEQFSIQDEHYRMELDASRPVEVLADTSVEPDSKKAYPAVWIVQDEKARIVGISLGHGKEAHGNQAYQRLLINAVRWTAGKQ
jgi:type 1 glutamine amidotransferase